ncbi:MAG: DUF4340 domain-containing protein [Candidatus Acidiferrales bacterium]
MKMKQLIAAAIVLVALTATLYWSNHHKPSEDSTAASASATVKVLSLKQDEITKLEVKRPLGEDVVLNRAGPDEWKITSPRPLFADRDTVSAILYNLSPLDNATLVENKPGDLKEFGLADPAITITATEKNGQSKTVLVGDNTPTDSGAYAIVSGDPKLYSIGTNTKASFNKSLADLRDKRLLPVDYDKISSVEITGPKLNLTFDSNDGQWTIQSPKGVRGDTSKLENIIEKLKLADMDPSTTDEDQKKAAEMFASGAPVAAIKATDALGAQTLQIRKNKSSYYAKTTAMEGTYKVADALGEAVNANIGDFREKRLFDFGEFTPDKIEMHDGIKAEFLTRNGEDWWSGDGKKMDPLSIDDLLRSIRELTATKLVNTGFARPELNLTVTSKSGKMVEKVAIAKQGNDFIAKRENDPILYEMEAKTIADLRKSADGVKPAKPVTPAKK